MSSDLEVDNSAELKRMALMQYAIPPQTKGAFQNFRFMHCPAPGKIAAIRVVCRMRRSSLEIVVLSDGNGWLAFPTLNPQKLSRQKVSGIILHIETVNFRFKCPTF
jgi:hypothetical protein